jgi:hypothetical protein
MWRAVSGELHELPIPVRSASTSPPCSVRSGGLGRSGSVCRRPFGCATVSKEARRSGWLTPKSHSIGDRHGIEWRIRMIGSDVVEKGEGS